MGGGLRSCSFNIALTTSVIIIYYKLFVFVPCHLLISFFGCKPFLKVGVAA